jgi:hypothetical protein
MKKYFIYIAIIIAVYFNGCDKPGPTELIDDETFDVEILGKDLDNEYYSNGYDTSGVTEDITRYASIISVSGIKLSYDNSTINLSSAQTFLFDRNDPFYSPGGTLLGYKTVTPGIIKFDNVQARLTNYRVRYKEAGYLIDTLLGKKYELFQRHGRILGDPFTFNYNSTINFSFNPFFGGQPTNFDITTPSEVIGSVKLITINDKKKFKAELSWNGESVNKFYIIIGGVKITNQQVFPLYKIKTKDDGKLNIPKSLLDNIPENRFNKISITFVRRYDKIVPGANNDIYVSSQSIHTVIVDLP